MTLLLKVNPGAGSEAGRSGLRLYRKRMANIQNT